MRVGVFLKTTKARKPLVDNFLSFLPGMVYSPFFSYTYNQNLTNLLYQPPVLFFNVARALKKALTTKSKHGYFISTIFLVAEN